MFAISGHISSAQTVQTIFSFGNGGYYGMKPWTLTLGNDGNFYGTTEQGGSYINYQILGYGTVFKVTPTGTLTSLISFGPYEYTGAGLTLGNDGNFYGATLRGGSSSHGRIFKMLPTGALTTLVSFNITNGANPSSSLTQDSDGNFYGMTDSGGITNLSNPSGYGTVFKVTTNGTLTTLVAFNGSNGSFPKGGLTQGNDGNFYGATVNGGSSGYGTLFKMTTNGTLTTLVSFSNTNGANPSSALTLGSDGNFYGTTEQGGITNSTYPSGYGTVFKVTTNGALTTLAFFNGTNGRQPEAALTLGYDGRFYGTTAYGGSSGAGTIFKVTTNGTLTTLISFNITNGQNPVAALTMGPDGNFYGTTGLGGSDGYGTIFLLLLPPPPQLTITSSSSNMILTWPTNPTGFTLQSTTNLVSPAVWITNFPAPTIVNGQNTVTNLISGTQKFFRLIGN